MTGSMTEAPWRTALTRARRPASVVAAAAVLLIGALAACAPGGEPAESDQEPAIDECPSGAVAIGTSASDLQTAPITLCGSAAAVIDGGPNDSGYALHLDGASHWVVRGFSVTGAARGIMLDSSSHNELQGLTVSNTGQEGVHLRAGSSDNLVQGLVVSDTGKTTPEYGEGIYIGTATSNWCDISACEPDRSDRNRVLDNKVFAVTAEAVDVKEGTTGGELRGNDLTLGDTPAVDSVVDLKGNEWTVSANHGP